MRLYLVQHGEAHPKEADPTRRLTEKGADDVRKVAGFLRPHGLRVDAIWHSGKPRAAETADILASAVKAAQGVVECKGLDPNDPVLPVAEEMDEAPEDLMIVGHMPFLARLASVLLAGDEDADIVQFHNAGVVCLERDEDGGWHMHWIVTPGLL